MRKKRPRGRYDILHASEDINTPDISARDACSIYPGDAEKQRDILYWFLKGNPCKRLPPGWHKVVVKQLAYGNTSGNPMYYEFGYARQDESRESDRYIKTRKKLLPCVKRGEVTEHKWEAWVLYAKDHASVVPSLFEVAASKLPLDQIEQQVPEDVAQRAKAVRMPWTNFFDPSIESSDEDSDLVDSDSEE